MLFDFTIFLPLKMPAETPFSVPFSRSIVDGYNARERKSEHVVRCSLTMKIAVYRKINMLNLGERQFISVERKRGE